MLDFFLVRLTVRDGETVARFADLVGCNLLACFLFGFCVAGVILLLDENNGTRVVFLVRDRVRGGFAVALIDGFLGFFLFLVRVTVRPGVKGVVVFRCFFVLRVGVDSGFGVLPLRGVVSPSREGGVDGVDVTENGDFVDAKSVLSISMSPIPVWLKNPLAFAAALRKCMSMRAKSSSADVIPADLADCFSALVVSSTDAATATPPWWLSLQPRWNIFHKVPSNEPG